MPITDVGLFNLLKLALVAYFYLVEQIYRTMQCKKTTKFFLCNINKY